MQTQTDFQLPFSVRFAHFVNRVLSWGMEPDARDALLAEALADWDDMQRTQGMIPVILRALRGIPTGVWARLDARETTALPVAVAVTTVGIGGFAAGLLERTYPLDVRRFVLLTALGTFFLGAVLIREPRRLELRRLRIPAVVLSAGFLGMAANIPSQHEWKYDIPYMDTTLIDRAMAFGFGAVGLGFAVIFVASFVARRHVLALTGGTMVVAGTAAFGCAQIAWGISTVTIDPMITATSIGIGLAALSFIHVVPRLRKLQIV